MNAPPSKQSPGKTIFAEVRHAFRHLPIPQLVRNPKAVILTASGLLFSALLWFRGTPSNEELLAYRMGYGMGQSLRAGAGEVDSDDLAEAMGVPDEERDMFETGFEDARKGREARYDAPSTFERFDQPGFGLSSNFTREEAAEFMRSIGRSPEELDEAPEIQPETEPHSPQGDYMINSLYGDTPQR